MSLKMYSDKKNVGFPWPEEEKVNVFLMVNASIFVFYTCLAAFVVIKTTIRRLDAVSLGSMTAVWICYFLRPLNWTILKSKTFLNDWDRLIYFTTVFQIVDLFGNTIFLLNA